MAEDPFERFRGRRGLVMGLGVFGGGTEAAKFLSRYCSSLVVTDLRGEEVLAESIAELEGLPIEYRLGEHRRQDFENAEVVIHSPAVRPDNPLLEAARKHGAEVTMEMTLFIEACPAKTVGITGSNGKTTTALLCYEMLCEVMQRAQPELEGKWAEPVVAPPNAPGRVWLGGNCGEPLINRIGEIAPDDLVVLELSSFQLQDWHRVRKSCDISVITNITPNHLDWHKSLEEYIWAKCAVYQYSGGVLIYNTDRLDSATLQGREGLTSIAYTVDGELPFARADFAMPGQFNWSNAQAAVAAAKTAAEVPDEGLARAAKRFRGVEHRLEFCGVVNGARCYNDSIATTPESTVAGLSAFDTDIHLILGGSDKGLSFDALAAAIDAHPGVVDVYLQGPNAPAIEAALTRKAQVFKRFSTFDEACEAAFKAALPGDVLLMSPASASFYEYAPNKRFTNFEDRGRHFVLLVQAHASNASKPVA
jgi:UDP-N-acetylmuramoylalanine--D-glutamate ligase